MHVWSLFLRSRYRIEDIFLGCQNFKYYFGVLEIPDIFIFFLWGGGITVDFWPKPTYEEKMRVSPDHLGSNKYLITT